MMICTVKGKTCGIFLFYRVSDESGRVFQRFFDSSAGEDSQHGGHDYLRKHDFGLVPFRNRVMAVRI